MLRRYSTTGSIMPDRDPGPKRPGARRGRSHSAMILALLLLLAPSALLAGCGGTAEEPVPAEDPREEETLPETAEYTYEASQEAFYNPLIGFAPEADYEEAVGENTLVYLGILWKDVEPEEGVYDFSLVAENSHLERWRQEGKHVVLRFLCDKPSKEEHMDIPEWLYEKTGDGTFYAYDSTHKGYSPDYSNPVFIEAHAKVVAALGEYFGEDGFVSYVELGSLGHWGEWHVNYESGIVRMPKEEIREQYVTPYLSAFPHAKILMRRPFRTAAKYGFGLYDDTAGSPEATETWLDWIRNGGDYRQAEEEDALVPMPDAWKTAPVGGEFNSDIPMTEMLTSELSTTLALLRQSHTSFLGPYCPTGLSEENGLGLEENIGAVRGTLGYRLRVERALVRKAPEESAYEVSLIWQNDGIAPMYWDWEVCLYFYDEERTLLGRWPVEMDTSGLLPGETFTSLTRVTEDLMERGAYAAVGIEDPMTGQPAVRLAMETDLIGLTHVLWERED